MEEKCLCKNCNTELQGNYCHTCGQKNSTGRLTMFMLLHSLFHGIFHCDRNILYTYYALFTRPGKMIAEYIAGRRIRYFNPFTTLIITAGIAGIFGEIMLAELHAPLPAPAVDGSLLSRLWHHLETNDIFKTIILLPLYALSTKWAMGKKSGTHYNYTELLVAFVYIACQRMMMIYILLEIPGYFIFGKNSLIVGSFKYLFYLLLIWNFKQLFQLSVMKSIWRTFLMTLCLLILTSILILVSALFTIFILKIPLDAFIRYIEYLY